MSKPRVAIVTSMPRNQRVEVYNEMARLDEVDFKVFYLQRMAHGRLWKTGPKIEHDAVFVESKTIYRQLYLNPGFFRQFLRFDANLTIVTGYYAPAMQLAMYMASLRRRQWVFWAEMAFTRFSERRNVPNQKLGNILRWAAMLSVRHLPSEIWAIGTRAQADYRHKVDASIPVRNLPYFADLDRFFAAGEKRQPSPRVRFLFSGSLIERKGADLVCSAIARLTEANYDFEVHVAGVGSLQHLFDALPPAAHQRVIMYGFLQLEQMAAIYAKADVLLFPSRHDGWGMTLGEGMAAALAPISTAQTGAAVDMIENGVSGIRLDELTLDSLESAMRFFLDQPDKIAPMGAAARKRAELHTHRVGARTFIDTIKSSLSRD